MVNYYNKNLYNILNVKIDASQEEIKVSYRKLVRTCHPDVTGNKADVEKFKEIQEAYEILSSESKRRKYDAINGFFKEKIKKEFENKQTDRNLYEEAILRAKKNSEKAESFSHSINEALDSLFHSSKQQKVKNQSHHLQQVH